MACSTCGGPLRERRRQRSCSRTTIPRRRCSCSRRPATRASRSPAGRDRPQHHHAGHAGADPGHARGRHQCRRPVDGLGLGGLAARQEGAAGQGGWNIFITTTGGVGSANPVLHTWIGAACDKGLFGWPCDAEIEELRNAYGLAPTERRAQEDRPELQTRAIEQVVYIPFGQWIRRSPTAPTASTGSCPTPGWRCCGASRRSRVGLSAYSPRRRGRGRVEGVMRRSVLMTPSPNRSP